jgi:hypothetical protein
MKGVPKGTPFIASGEAASVCFGDRVHREPSDVR